MTKPSDDMKQRWEAAKQHSEANRTKTAAWETADKVKDAIAWIRHDLMSAEIAHATGDITRFVNAKKEVLFAKDELAVLLNLQNEINGWLLSHDL